MHRKDSRNDRSEQKPVSEDYSCSNLKAAGWLEIYCVKASTFKSPKLDLMFLSFSFFFFFSVYRPCSVWWRWAEYFHMFKRSFPTHSGRQMTLAVKRNRKCVTEIMCWKWRLFKSVGSEFVLGGFSFLTICPCYICVACSLFCFQCFIIKRSHVP